MTGRAKMGAHDGASALATLSQALHLAASDLDALSFVRARLTSTLLRVGPFVHGAERELARELKFRRQLGLAWLDAPDAAARAIVRTAIRARLTAGDAP